MEQFSRRKHTRCNTLLDLLGALSLNSFGSVSSALPPSLERLPTQTLLVTAFRRSVQLVDIKGSLFRPVSWMEQEVFEDVDGLQRSGSLWICTSCGSWWQICRFSQWDETKGRHGFAPRRHLDTWCYCTDHYTCFQNLRTDLQTLCGTNLTYDVEWGTRLSPWSSRCYSPRFFCNGICMAQRFHMDGEDQRCRPGCHDELDSLFQQRMPFSLQLRDRRLEEWCSSFFISLRPSFSLPYYPYLFKKPPIWDRCLDV